MRVREVLLTHCLFVRFAPDTHLLVLDGRLRLLLEDQSFLQGGEDGRHAAVVPGREDLEEHLFGTRRERQHQPLLDAPFRWQIDRVGLPILLQHPADPGEAPFDII